MENTKKPQPKRRTVHLSLWVDPKLKEGLELKAKGNKISVSATGGAYLKKALQQDADIKYGALMEHLDPTFEEFRIIEGSGLHQHWRDALAHEREACFA
jgi:hypothetical protein